ncbi:MAG: hypothetical protein HOW73_34835 [Polyangiaceae bacterium]|nr:hypothetical protein [Polyangiaceae bacterium]
MKRLAPSVALLALAACSSSGGKVPLAPGERFLSDRIEALEADIAQLHAEMEELRVDYAPIEEMSEAEFERHLEKRLAKAPADARPALEKELRAKRKAATLSGKALVAYWEERFTNEADDPAWAKVAETACKPRLEKALSPGGKIHAFECKKERCRTEIELTADGPAADAAVTACTSEPTDAETFAESATMSRITGSNGHVRAIVYIARKGYSMAVE